MDKKKRVITVLLVICLAVTMMPMNQVEEYKASEKVGSELLEVLGVTYEELTTGEFVDAGEAYSCIIWLQDVEIEEAVEAGIDAAEMTREGYSIWSMYDYPYTTYEAEGLTYVDVEFDETETDEYIQTYIEAERESAAEVYNANNSSFVAENFMARDMSVTYVSQYSPCVFADLNITKISELIKCSDVVTIGYINSDAKYKADSASTTDATLNLEEIEESMEIVAVDRAKEIYDVTGAGVKIGLVDVACPNVSSVEVNPSGCNTLKLGKDDRGVVTMVETSHPDNVYLILSTIASGATYYATGEYDGNTTDSNITSYFEQVEWLLSQGVNIINMSSGYMEENGSDLSTYDEYARWTDHIAYNHDVHFVKSAGNEGSLGVTSPGMAYNIITVGNIWRFSPGSLIYDSSYNADGVSIEDGLTYKPDMVAPGHYIDGQWGTSYSAPLVTATIALMCEYEPALKTKQHAVKAILAASTGKEIGRYVTTDAEFSQYGAGVIDARAAIWVVSQANYSYSTGSLTNAGNYKTYTMTVTSSDTCMRIALAYANRIKFGTGEEHTEENLPSGTIGVVGLTVYSPTGEQVLSTDWFTRGINLQVVEFDPTEYGTGTYTIKVFLIEPASDGRTTNFGIAWR